MKVMAQKEKQRSCTKADCGLHGDGAACCKHLLCINKVISNLPFCMALENKHLISCGLLERVCSRLQGALLVSEG